MCLNTPALISELSVVCCNATYARRSSKKKNKEENGQTQKKHVSIVISSLRGCGSS